MEGIFLVLIAGALFSQSWYVLGMHSEGRTTGVFVGGLGLVSLGTVAAFLFAPTLLTGVDALAETTVMKTLIITWSLYAVGVSAHGLWDFDERAIGFYCAFLAVVSAVCFSFFTRFLVYETYTVSVGLGLSGATLVLAILAGLMFFYLALGFNVLRLVAGWFLLLGSIAVTAIGLSIVSTAIS